MPTIISPGIQDTNWAGGGGLESWFYDPDAWRRPGGLWGSKLDQARLYPRKPKKQPATPQQPWPTFTPPPTPQPGPVNVMTDINPQPIFTDAMTQRAVNNAVAANTPDMRFATKKYTRPGASTSVGTMGAAAPDVVRSMGAQREAAATIPLLDTITNQKHLLAGERMREEQALSLANLMSRLQALKTQQGMASTQQGVNLLLSLLR